LVTLADNGSVEETMVEAVGRAAKAEPDSAELSEMAKSLLALHRSHVPASSEKLAEELEAEAAARAQAREQAGEHSRAMAAMYVQIAALLDELREAIVAGNWGGTAEQVRGEIQTGLARLDERLEASEVRQREAMATMMETLRTDRQNSQQEARLEREALSVEAQMEVNRLLRVMWLATGMAAVGAGTALFLLQN
jgi:hypothetical protein